MVASIAEPVVTLPQIPSAARSDLFWRADNYGIRDIHICNVPELELRGIVAIHSTALGPALGGTRCVRYASLEAAMFDAFRLARGMSYKAAIHGLPFGGGKAVLLKPPVITNREAYFEAWGDFIDTLAGRYITAEDSGTSVADMDVVARRTRHVAGTSALGDPSAYTAFGVRRAIEAAVAFATGRDSLADVHVAVQGVGAVGHALVAELVACRARVTVADTNETAAQRCAAELGANVVAPEEILGVAADVFAPCALGGVIGPASIADLGAPIIVGSANNQLAEESFADTLHERGILHAPDYVANGGGLMRVAGLSDEATRTKADKIYELVLELFTESRAQNLSPFRIANRRAERVLNGTGR